MTRVAVSGAGGRMGRLVCEAIHSHPGFDLVAGYDPSHAGETVASVTITADRAVVGGADVVVEFTVPDAVAENLAAWRSLGVHAVVGTSGFDAARIAALSAAWGEAPPNCLVVPNFSIGAVLMMRFSETAAQYFGAAEIIEMHHEGKVDAPSGTAIATAERIRGAGGDQRQGSGSVENLAGARGTEGEPRIHSVRMPGIVAKQDVIFGGLGETLTIAHETTDRASFMPGVLLAIAGVAGLSEPVTVGLEAVL